MSSTVDIALTGEPLPGFEPEQVAVVLAKLLKLDEQQARGLLTGQETMVKRQLPVAQLDRYLSVLQATGAATRVHGLADADGLPALDFAVALPDAMPAQRTTPPSPVPVVPVVPVSDGIALVEAAPAESIVCPVCQFAQPKRTLCRQCGADMPRVLAAQLAPAAPPSEAHAPISSVSRYQPAHRVQVDEGIAWVDETPKAFGWGFKGRIGRLRYLAYMLHCYVPLFAGAFVVGLLGGLTHSKGVALGLGIPVGIAVCWQFVRLNTLRLHDMNRSGLWQMLPLGLIPIAVVAPLLALILIIVIGLASLWLWLSPGTGGSNDYGPPPDQGGTLMTLGAVAFMILSLYGAYHERQHPDFHATNHSSTDAVASEAMEKAFGDAVDQEAEKRGITLTNEQRAQAINNLKQRWSSQRRQPDE